MAAPSTGRSNTCTTAILPRQRRELLGRPASSASLSQRYHISRPLLAALFYHTHTHTHTHTRLPTHAVLAGPSLGGVIAATRVALGLYSCTLVCTPRHCTLPALARRIAAPPERRLATCAARFDAFAPPPDTLCCPPNAQDTVEAPGRKSPQSTKTSRRMYTTSQQRCRR